MAELSGACGEVPWFRWQEPTGAVVFLDCLRMKRSGRVENGAVDWIFCWLRRDSLDYGDVVGVRVIDGLGKRALPVERMSEGHLAFRKVC